MFWCPMEVILERNIFSWAQGSQWLVSERFWSENYQHWMIRWGHRMERRMNSWRSWAQGSQWLVAPNVTMLPKNRPSEHPMVYFNYPFKQRFFKLLGYLYPLHLTIWSCWMKLKCVGVHWRVRHIKNTSKPPKSVYVIHQRFSTSLAKWLVLE